MSPIEIKNLRNSLGLSQAQFADRLYVTRETVARWENGGSKPIRALTAAMQAMAPPRVKHKFAIAKQLMVPGTIKRLRQKVGWSQRELAEHLHVERETVARWEIGAQLPQPVCIAALNELSLRVTKQACFTSTFQRRMAKLSLAS
jgi:DNA-binding transcriptional regulator YiaG